jgi:hydroxymethylpyrimidine pyrophosphatase-like HAD family hydrolase
MKPKKTVFYLDFDKTLAVRNKGDSVFKCGPAIPKMVDRVKQWLADGHKVLIFTARSGDAQIRPVKQFLKDNGLPDLEVTNIKGSRGDWFYDDKAVPVRRNTGELPVEEAEILFTEILNDDVLTTNTKARIRKWLKDNAENI